jgi:hypothetical protein
MSSLPNAVGLILAFMGFGMELIRPALYRWQIEVPKWLDTVLGTGGLVCIAFGLYLMWSLIKGTVHIQSPVTLGPHPASLGGTPWPDAAVFVVIIIAVLWAAVSLPKRLVPQMRPAYFDLGFMVGRLKNKEAAEPHKLEALKLRCQQLGLSYAAAKLQRVIDAIDLDRFVAEESGLSEHGDFRKSEAIFDREMADLETVISKECEQIQRKSEG